MLNDKGIKLPEKRSLRSKFYGWWYDTWIYGKYQYSWAYKLRWFVTHWWRHDNWIKTNLDINYHDKVGLMEDGLFSMVENFISRDEEDAPSTIVMEDPWYTTIIEIIHFYRIRKPELEAAYDLMLHECFGPVEMMFIDDGNPHGKRLNLKYNGPMTEEEREEKIKRMRDLEKYIFDETQLMLKKCIDVRAYLWS